jgi:hypothetical protein
MESNPEAIKKDPILWLDFGNSQKITVTENFIETKNVQSKINGKRLILLRNLCF